MASVKNTLNQNVEKVIEECMICCEKYNKSSRKKIICPNPDCSYECCTECFKTFINERSNNPSCMNCKTMITPQFIVTNINKTYYNGEFKKKLKEKLWESEHARFPETMDYMTSVIKLRKNEKILEEYRSEIKQYKDKIDSLKRQSYIIENKIYRFKNMNQHNVFDDPPINDGENVNGPADQEQYNRERATRFIMPCRNTDCNGYLNTKYKCELCETFTCAKCFEFIGKSEDKETHECKEENIQSAELIRKETKPCPKCGTRISKISGCDQMWCTECKVAFSWRSGMIETGTIHNPHYYQWMRQNKSGEMRNPLDQICGGLQDIRNLSTNVRSIYIDLYKDLEETEHGKILFKNNYNTFEKFASLINNIFDNLFSISRRQYYYDRVNHYQHKLLKELIKDSKNKYDDANINNITIISIMHRNLNHIINDEIPNLVRTLERLQDNSQLRVNYMIKDINKETFIQNICKRNTEYMCNQEILLLYQVIRNFGIDLFNELVIYINTIETICKNIQNDLKTEHILLLDDNINKLINFWDNKTIESKNLIHYVNNQMRQISITYNRTVPLLSTNFRINATHKFNVKITQKESELFDNLLKFNLLTDYYKNEKIM